MNRISQIWQQLATQTGIFRRIRYEATSPCDLYLGLKMPENERILALRLPVALAKGIRNRPPSQGIRVEKITDPDDKNRFFLNLVLTDQLFANVFDVLLDDLVSQLLNLTDPKQVVQTFLNQLDRWEALFSRFSANGLTIEQQKGLYGELYVLRKMLAKLSDTLPVVESWVGSDAAVQDFRANGWAIEVKTSSRTTLERFTVNGERQLDESPLDWLFLYYLNVDNRTGTGESLNALIAHVRNSLKNDVSALILFNRKLSNTGYFDAQADLYEQTIYVVRSEHAFRISGNFPRIVTADLRPGVGEVHYSVSLSDCLPYLIPENELFQTLTHPNGIA
jgi:hypothetical protein